MNFHDKLFIWYRRPHLVTIDWVLQSVKDGNPADEENFKFDPHNCTHQDTFNAPSSLHQSSRVARVSATALESHLPDDNSNQSRSPPPAKSKSSESEKTSNSKGSSSVSLTNGLKSSSKSESTSERATTKSGSRRGSTSNSSSSTDSNTTGISEADESNSTKEGNCTSNGQEENTSTHGFLYGINFNVIINDKEEESYIKDIIEENKGRIVSSNADVVILDPVCSPVEKDRADKSCTKYWLV